MIYVETFYAESMQQEHDKNLDMEPLQRLFATVRSTEHVFDRPMTLVARAR